MNLKKSAMFRVGLFVSIGLALAMVALFFIGQEKSFFGKRYTLYARFSDISGLRIGAVVQLAGLNVGYVSGVRFVKDDKALDTLELILKINQEFHDRIRKDSEVSLETQGLLGDKYVLITTGSSNMPPLKNGEALITAEGGAVSLQETGKKTMEEIQAAARKMREVLEKLPLDDVDQARMRRILEHVDVATDDISVITTKIRNGQGSLGAFLTDPSLYNDMRSLLGHANRNKMLRGLIRATIAEQEEGTDRAVSK